jgi:hypothetical protein
MQSTYIKGGTNIMKTVSESYELGVKSGYNSGLQLLDKILGQLQEESCFDIDNAYEILRDERNMNNDSDY